MAAFELPIREETALPIRARVRKQWAQLVEIPQPHSILRTDTASTNAFHTSPRFRLLEGHVIQPRQSITKIRRHRCYIGHCVMWVSGVSGLIYGVQGCHVFQMAPVLRQGKDI